MNSVDEIVVLEGLEAVRKRPGMYVGDTRDGSGLHHLAWEVIGNAIDQHLCRNVRRLSVDIEDEWVTVEDDGLGMRPTIIETVLTQLHACGSWDNHVPHVHVGESPMGLGLAPVNALCARFDVESCFEGRAWSIAFERGRTVRPLTCTGATTRSGTRVRFRPDDTIFSTAKLDVRRIAGWLTQLAWLHPLLEVSFCRRVFDNRQGLRGWARSIASDETVAPIVSSNRAIDDVFVDIALGWTNRVEGTLLAFVNDQSIPKGTHVKGMWAGIAHAAQHKRARVIARLFPGMVGVLSVTMNSPQYAGNIRDTLASSNAHRAVRRTVLDLLRTALHSPVLRELFEKRLAPDAPDWWNRKAA